MIKFAIFIFFLLLTHSTFSQNSIEITEGYAIGNKAPNIILSGLDGSTQDLSSLEGSVVLIDFWASFCGPCRAESAYLTEAYHTFKNTEFTIGKGFTIFSVSIDADTVQWKKAIEKDSLLWQTHGIDDLSWNSMYLIMYGIKGIPANFLIDKHGVIIAKNLRKEQISITLQKYVK